MNIKRESIILAFIITIGFFSCQKAANVQLQEIPTIELNTWLVKNGKNFKNGKFILKDKLGKQLYGQLNWNEAKLQSSPKHDFIEVPFKIYYDTIKSGAIINNLNFSSSIIFQKDKSGNIGAAIKLNFLNDIPQKNNPYFSSQTLYTLDGIKFTTWIRKNSFSSLIQVYQKKTIMQQANSIKESTNYKNNTIDDPGCSSYSIPEYTYVCAGTSGSGDYNVTCGYLLTGQEVYTECVQQEDPSSQPPTIDYLDLFFGTNNKSNTVNDSLQNYPCAKNILNTMVNMNVSISSLIKNLYNSNQDINLLFVPRTFSSTDIDGEYYTKIKDGTNFGTGWADQKIGISTYVLNNSTQEYILTTLIHESIHAYISYQKLNLSESDFETQMPSYAFWYADSPPYKDTDHTVMISDFYKQFSDLLKAFNNNLDDETIKSLILGGLYKTNYWKSCLSDSERLIYNNTNLRERNVNDTTTYGKYKGSKCN